MEFLRGLSRFRSRAYASSRAWAPSVPPLVARYVLGVVFVSTGASKLRAIGDVAELFAGLGIALPTFMAVLVGATELGCGGLLLIGLATRLAAIPLAAVMTVALATAKGAVVSAGLLSFLATTEVAYLVLLLYVLVLGPGDLAVDRWIALRLERTPKLAPNLRPAEAS